MGPLALLAAAVSLSALLQCAAGTSLPSFTVIVFPETATPPESSTSFAVLYASNASVLSYTNGVLSSKYVQFTSADAVV